ncbi:MAG: hypothetical protein ACYC69_04280 [Thermodesulfovibrionales bacterium]
MDDTKGTGPTFSERFRALAGVLCALALFMAVLAEGYYIFSLRDIIERQSDELKNTSLQLESLRNASSSLREELDSIKKMAGDRKDGTTP